MPYKQVIECLTRIPAATERLKGVVCEDLISELLEASEAARNTASKAQAHHQYSESDPSSRRLLIAKGGTLVTMYTQLRKAVGIQHTDNDGAHQGCYTDDLNKAIEISSSHRRMAWIEKAAATSSKMIEVYEADDDLKYLVDIGAMRCIGNGMYQLTGGQQ